jgi:hypothetical protein
VKKPEKKRKMQNSVISEKVKEDIEMEIALTCDRIKEKFVVD